MKIFIAREKKEFLQRKTKIKYPPNNTNKSFSIEQDFYRYIKKSRMVTKNYQEADWIYIPVFWQRHCYNNNYYLNETGLDEIRSYLTEISRDKGKKYFVVSAIDGGPLGAPRRREMIADAVFFNGCIGDEEVTSSNVYNIPLITSEWKIKLRNDRKHIASFTGRKDTHTMRKEMFGYLENKKGICLADGYVKDYAGIIADSLVSLCPRGCGLSSFRFYESMQIGVVPVMVADYDVRPFKDQIDWNEISFFVKDMNELDRILNMDPNQLIKMGIKAREIYYNYINYGKWYQFVFKILERL